MNNAAVNILVYLSSWHTHSVGLYLGMELLGHKVQICLSSLKCFYKCIFLPLLA